MARPRNNSCIQVPPRIKGFVPLGYYANESDPIQLNIEEFESIRLLDYENQSQLEASSVMGVSRPTLTRIYERARKKVAKALTESHQILIEGGKAVYSDEWFTCFKCECKFNNPLKEEVKNCPLCSSNKIENITSS